MLARQVRTKGRLFRSWTSESKKSGRIGVAPQLQQCPAQPISAKTKAAPAQNRAGRDTGVCVDTNTKLTLFVRMQILIITRGSFH